MRRIILARAALALSAGLLLPSAGPAQQITLGQIDTFENPPPTSPTLGWTNGGNLGAIPPTVVAGGPAGPNDHYLQVVSNNGFGGSSRMTVFNRAQWLGDYNAAGVNDIDLDLMAPSGGTPLSMRIAFKVNTTNFSSGYVSTVAFALPADGQWHHTDFPLTVAAMTAIGGPPPLATVLSNPAEVRILSSTSPSLNGDGVVATLGVDNIHAWAVVPEPSCVLAVALAGAGVAGPLVRRWRGGRS